MKRPRPLLCRRERRGFSLIAVLALMSLAGSLLVVWTRHALQEQRVTRTSHQQVQAEWLTHAALSRAAASLTANPQYSGETWRLSPDELAQPYAAEVLITIERRGDVTSATVQVDLPPGEERIVRHTQVANINQPPLGEKP